MSSLNFRKRTQDRLKESQKKKIINTKAENNKLENNDQSNKAVLVLAIKKILLISYKIKVWDTKNKQKTKQRNDQQRQKFILKIQTGTLEKMIKNRLEA